MLNFASIFSWVELASLFFPFANIYAQKTFQ